jgi:hypothetical protein
MVTATSELSRIAALSILESWDEKERRKDAERKKATTHLPPARGSEETGPIRSFRWCAPLPVAKFRSSVRGCARPRENIYFCGSWFIHVILDSRDIYFS